MSVNWKPSKSVVSDGRSSKNSKVVGKKRGSTSEKKIIKEIKNPELMVEQAIGKPYFIVPDKKTETKVIDHINSRKTPVQNVKRIESVGGRYPSQK